MTRALTITRNKSIANLSWVVKIPAAGPIHALVGPWVETGDDFLLEGCWNGELGAADFDQSYSFMGSGVILRDEEVVVVCPCNTTEAVYSIRNSDSVLFSNSIPLLLKVDGKALDLTYLDYEPDFMSISQGLSAYRRSVPLAGGHELGIHYFCNLHVDGNLRVRETAKPVPGPFNAYDEYRAFLSDEIAGMAANASDRRRVQRYAPIVFCSTGYDSSACAVLGREVGCEEAVVFESKRGRRVDSGKAIVDALGYPIVHEKWELDYRNEDSAHLFLGNGELGTSIFFAGAASELRGKLLLSGVHGDKMWNRHAMAANPDLVRSPYPDTARKEFRLAVGYLNVPPAFLTAGRHEDIHRISNSPEMGPWTLNNAYDRPIPRRIAEEAGVPRESFGQWKGGGAGGSLRFGTMRFLRRVMPPPSFRRFEAYTRSVGRRRPSPEYLTRAAAYWVFMLARYGASRGVTPPYRLLRVDAWPPKYRCSVFAPSRLFPWGVHELSRTTYASAALPD